MARSAAILLGILLSACTGFREVLPGVYRTPQASEERLSRRIDAHAIKTVVCLRGDSVPQETSARSAAATKTNWIQVRMSATRRPKPATLLALWNVAATAERPLLLHCRAGVDRTGLASALIVLHDTGDLARARDQPAFLPNGHLGVWGTEEMGRVLDGFAPWQPTMTFPEWVANVYAKDFPDEARAPLVPALMPVPPPELATSQPRL
jgi:protein tyrosine phosphatase (PTP) superfamily phosphohydrolase (DUF442 family)